MAEQEMQASDKVVQEMTRNGLVDKNLVSGSIDRISERIVEQQYREQQEALQLGTRHEELQNSCWKNTRKQQQPATAGSELIREYQKEPHKKQSSNQVPEKSKLSGTPTKGATLKNDKNSNRLKEHTEGEQGQSRLHHRNANMNPNESITEKESEQNKYFNRSRSVDVQKQTKNRHVETIQQKHYEFRKIKQKGEQKVFEREDDNLSLEATHSTYRTLRRPWKRIKRIYNRQRLGKIDTGRAVAENKQNQRLKNSSGRLQSSNIQTYEQSSKREQTKMYQKRYAQKVRDSIENSEAFQQKVQSAQAGAQALKETFAKQKYIALVIVLVLILFILLFGVIIAVGMTIFGGATNYTKGTIQADYKDLTDIESYFKQAEAELEYRIEHIETEFPDYDKYYYELGEIGHDSVLLLSYFGAKYGNFTFEQIQAELTEIFDSMYELRLEEEIETRYRIEKVYDPLTGEYKDKRVAYEYKILNVILIVTDLESILEPRLETDEQKNQWQIYQESQGNQQIYGNPLPMNWHQHITSQFGYRVHPISGDLKFHSGVDIAAPAGTNIYSCTTGTVLSAGWSDSYGYNVVVQNASGYRTRYAHCSVLHVSDGDAVKKGDTIAEVGSTGNSTGNHLHLECIAVDGTYLNPLYMVSNFASGGN